MQPIVAVKVTLGASALLWQILFDPRAEDTLCADPWRTERVATAENLLVHKYFWIFELPIAGSSESQDQNNLHFFA